MDTSPAPNGFEYTATGQYLERQPVSEIELPAPVFSSEFVWVPEYYSVLARVAATNQVQDWPLLRDILKYKLAETIKTYLSLGPPWPLEPAGALVAQSQACLALDSFVLHPPFTIQRLAELVHDPQLHYSTLPKYLRALTRAISVTSDQTAFPATTDAESPFASTSHLEDPATLGMGLMPTTGGIHSPTRRPIALARTSSSSSSSSSRSASVPLLSPIPWLIRNDGEGSVSDISELGVETGARTNGDGSPSRAQHLTAQSMTLPAQLVPTNTPTGGVVDELDLGTGDAEIAAAPVALTGSLSPTRDVPDGTSLAERFERARSPRAIRDPTEEDSTNEVSSLSSLGSS